MIEAKIVNATTNGATLTATVCCGWIAAISFLFSIVIGIICIGVGVAVGLHVADDKIWKIPLLFGGVGTVLAFSAVVCKVFDIGTHLAEKMMDTLVEYKKIKKDVDQGTNKKMLDVQVHGELSCKIGKEKDES